MLKQYSPVSISITLMGYRKPFDTLLKLSKPVYNLWVNAINYKLPLC